MNAPVCDHHDLPLVNGWHELVDPEGIEGIQRIPCPLVRSLYAAAIEAWPASLPVAEQEAPAFIKRLEESGYVLVNAEGLAAAIRPAMDSLEAKDWTPTKIAAAILAAIQEQTDE